LSCLMSCLMCCVSVLYCGRLQISCLGSCCVLCLDCAILRTQDTEIIIFTHSSPLNTPQIYHGSTGQVCVLRDGRAGTVLPFRRGPVQRGLVHTLLLCDMHAFSTLYSRWYESEACILTQDLFHCFFLVVSPSFCLILSLFLMQSTRRCWLWLDASSRQITSSARV